MGAFQPNQSYGVQGFAPQQGQVKAYNSFVKGMTVDEKNTSAPCKRSFVNCDLVIRQLHFTLGRSEINYRNVFFNDIGVYFWVGLIRFGKATFDNLYP